MYIIKPDVERPDREPVETFEEIPSTTVSNVTGNVGLAMDASLRPVYGGVEMAGTAVTMKAAPSDSLIIYRTITLTEPGDALTIGRDGYAGTDHADKLMCTSCQVDGLAELIIDDAYRNSHEIVEIEFPMHGHGVNPQGPLKQDPGSVSITVPAGGVSVDLGDIAIGDDDGSAIIPRRGAEEVLERVHEKLSTEDSAHEEVPKDEYLYELNGYDELPENLTIVGPEDSIH